LHKLKYPLTLHCSQLGWECMKSSFRKVLETEVGNTAADVAVAEAYTAAVVE
jgi:hypothetical protein